MHENTHFTTLFVHSVLYPSIYQDSVSASLRLVPKIVVSLFKSIILPSSGFYSNDILHIMQTLL